MAIQPASPANFTYKKYSSSAGAPIQLYFPNILNAVTDTKFISATGGASWIKLSDIRFENYNGYATLSINTRVADNLSPGTHSVSFEFILTTTEIDAPGATFNSSLGVYRVNLTVTDTIRLAIRPSTFSFSYKDGDPTPLDQELLIKSENNWSIVPSESWVTLSQSNGNGSGSVLVGVDVSGLDFGLYESLVTINDGFFTKSFTVYLTVDIPQTTDDYIFLNPQNLEFLNQEGVANASVRTLVIDAGNDWSISADQPWIQFSQSNGALGITEVEVSVESVGLQVGVYSTQVTATSGGVVKKAYVVLRVIELSIEGIENGGVYFADDRIYLSVGSIGENSFLQLNLEASTDSMIKNYDKTQPYFRGVARALIGTSANLLVEKLDPFADLVSGVKKSIGHLVLKISAFEQSIFTGITTSVANYTNVRFLKGSTPSINNRLCYLPSKITTSGSAVIVLHVRADIDPGDIIISGDIDHVIAGPAPNNALVYSALVNLSEFDLVTGDILTIVYGDQTVVIEVDNDIVESNLLAFENEWGMFEFFETKGFRSKIPSTRQKTYEVSIEGKRHTKVLDAPKGRTYRFNTGNMGTEDEVEWMASMLFSKRIFMYENGQPIEVLITNRNILERQTRRRVMNFDLEFKKAVE